MELIKEMLETCSAGTNFKSAKDCKLVVEVIKSHCSETTINEQNDNFYHLRQCVTQCERICNSTIWTTSYKNLVENLIRNWDILGNWTWPYRVLLDIIKMDTAFKNYGL